MAAFSETIAVDHPQRASFSLGARRARAGLIVRHSSLARPADICNLETEISAPPGHLVVLGVTPADNVASAFVIQVIRKEAKKPGPGK
jgi:hypothetical protein